MLKIVLAFGFLAAQMAASIHGFYGDRESSACCRDGTKALHLCACTVDHHAPPCAICTQVSGACTGDVSPIGSIENGGVPAALAADAVCLPCFASTEDSRGPPLLAA